MEIRSFLYCLRWLIILHLVYVQVQLYDDPKVTITDHGTKPIEGEPFRLSCIAFSDIEAPKVTWKIDEEKAWEYSVTNYFMQNMSTESILQFPRTPFISKDIIVSCFAEIKIGDKPEVKNVSYTLKIQYTPKSQGFELQNGIVVGASASMTCKFFSEPNVTSLTWKKNGEDFQFSSNETRISIETQEMLDLFEEMAVRSNLTIHSLELLDEGNYSCVAKNSLGTGETLFEINVEEGRSLDQTCRFSESCQAVTNNTFCDKICICDQGFFRLFNNCWEGVALGEKCTSKEQCQVMNNHTDCKQVGSSRLCKCSSGYVLNSAYKCIESSSGHERDLEGKDIALIIIGTIIFLGLLAGLIYLMFYCRSRSVHHSHSESDNIRSEIILEESEVRIEVT